MATGSLCARKSLCDVSSKILMRKELLQSKISSSFVILECNDCAVFHVFLLKIILNILADVLKILRENFSLEMHTLQGAGHLCPTFIGGDAISEGHAAEKAHFGS